MSELFKDFENIVKASDKVKFLEENWSPTLKLTLLYAFSPKYNFKKFDDKRLNNLNYSTEIESTLLGRVYKKMYLLIDDGKLSEDKMYDIYIGMLESLEEDEANILKQVVKKNLKVKGLTNKFVDNYLFDMMLSQG